MTQPKAVVFALIATLMLGVTSRPGAAQERARSGSWVEAGLGVGALPDAAGLAAELELAHQHRHDLFSLRGSLVTDFFNDGLADLGFLYGRARSRAGRFIAASAGIALVDSDISPPTGPRHPVYTVGVPLVLAASLRAGGAAGLGIQAFADLNPEHSFGGAQVTVQLGLLR